MGDNFNFKKKTNKITKAYIIGKHTLHFKNLIKNKVNFLISGNIKKAVDDIHNDLKYDDCKICRAIDSPSTYGMDSEIWNNSTWVLAHASVERHGHNEIVGCYTRHDFQFRVAELHSLQHHIRTVLKKHDSLFDNEAF